MSSDSNKLHVIGVSERAGGVAGGFLGSYDAQNSDSCRCVPSPPRSLRRSETTNVHLLLVAGNLSTHTACGALRRVVGAW
jgi:hypothetical protein